MCISRLKSAIVSYLNHTRC